MSQPIDRILEIAGRFAPVKKTRTGWSTQCPAHEDTNPSLSIGIGHENKVIIYCHAGCSSESVVKAFGIEMTDLFPDSKPDLVESKKSQFVTKYEYFDETNKLLFVVRRYEPKSFRPYLPGAAYAGLAEDTRRVPYHLPQLLEAVKNGEPVFIVEGEKDVETMERAGHVATTNPFGSSSWLPEFAEYCAGSSLVTIIADNDESGKKWAIEVAQSLENIQQNYEMLVTPGPTGVDITDHFEQGLAVKDLQKLESIADVIVESTNPFIVSLVDWSLLLSSNRTQQDWFCEPILASGRGHSLYSQAKVGKSYFTLPMAAKCSQGEAWLSMPEQEPRHILYADHEMTESDLWERIQDFGYDAKSDLSHLHYCLLPASEGLDTLQGGRDLVEAALDLKCELVIIDTLSRALEGEENSADSLRRFYKYTGQKLKTHKITMLRLDHSGKDEVKGTRGTSAKADDVDIVSRIRRLNDEQIEIQVTHTRIGWMPNRTKISVIRGADGVVRHTLDSNLNQFSDSAKEDATMLKLIGCDRATSHRKASLMAEEAGIDMTQLRVREALRYIKQGESL